MTHDVDRHRFSRTKVLLSAATIIGLSWTVRHWAGTETASAAPPPVKQAAKPAANLGAASQAPAAPAQPKQQPIVALVNGETIMRDELAKECLQHYGKEVLESLVNRRLIDKHCRDQNVAVSQQEVDAEIDKIARKFSLPKDEYLKMLEKERHIKPAQYGRDVVWPTLALRKLATAKLTVSPQELKDAYESQFGPAVEARLIAVSQRKKAEEALAKAKAKPDEFGVVARNYSEDVNSASANGLIQPIRRHLGEPKIEEAAFSLKPGQISPIIEIGNQFVILKCEKMIDATQLPDPKKYDAVLTEAIKERKLRAAAADTFQTLQAETKVENIMNHPALRSEMPGVAALVNGEKIMLSELGDQCIERHGKEVLEGIIHRHLLEQSLKRRKLAVTEDDVQAELGRAAVAMGVTRKDGEADIPKWLQTVEDTQGIKRDVYIHDAVWPSAAMKKLVGDNVPVTEEDLKKGFEANYGPRVRVRAIMLNSQRKAQEVWDLARQNLTVKHFGDLAEQYSVEANSRSLRGEVPPVQKHGGQPVLEKEAFSLKPGEMSGVIQVADMFMILYCEGYTQPYQKDFAAVRDQLFEDLHEKKQRLAMGHEFEKIKTNATIDNYLAGTTHAPKREKKLVEDDMLGEQKMPQPRAAGATARSAPKR